MKGAWKREEPGYYTHDELGVICKGRDGNWWWYPPLLYCGVAQSAMSMAFGTLRAAKAHAEKRTKGE